MVADGLRGAGIGENFLAKLAARVLVEQGNTRYNGLRYLLVAFELP